MKKNRKLKSAVCSCLSVKPKRSRRHTVGLVKYKSNPSCNGSEVQSFTRLKRSRSRSRQRRKRGRSRSRSSIRT